MHKTNSDNFDTDASPISAPDLLDDADDVDVEMALFALSAQDMGEPTEAVDLSALSDGEKRALLALMRERLHLPPSVLGNPDAGEEAARS